MRAHVDKVDKFTDTVYTCVLQTTCKQALTMFPPSDLLQARSFPLTEAPGRVFAFSGEARYDWEHGVPVITEGERVSVSWRPRLSVGSGPGPSHVVLLSFCDGIGAVPLAANRIWPGKVVTFAWEILPHATKMAQHHIPGYHHHGDLRDITDQLLAYMLKMVHVIIVVAVGFPCQDNSTLRGQKKGLFYDIEHFGIVASPPCFLKAEFSDLHFVGERSGCIRRGLRCHDGSDQMLLPDSP